MVIDGCDKFAKRTALWIMQSGMSKDEAVERLRMFQPEHLRRITAQAKAIKGIR